MAHRPEGWPSVFAVDASSWARCDAETSPERGFYYSDAEMAAIQPQLKPHTFHGEWNYTI